MGHRQHAVAGPGKVKHQRPVWEAGSALCAGHMRWTSASWTPGRSCCFASLAGPAAGAGQLLQLLLLAVACQASSLTSHLAGQAELGCWAGQSLQCCRAYSPHLLLGQPAEASRDESCCCLPQFGVVMSSSCQLRPAVQACSAGQARNQIAFRDSKAAAGCYHHHKLQQLLAHASHAVQLQPP